MICSDDELCLVALCDVQRRLMMWSDEEWRTVTPMISSDAKWKLVTVINV